SHRALSEHKTLSISWSHYRFTLCHCVGMITFLIHYLRTPEEKVENIFMLYGADKNNKLRRRLIYDALGIIQSQQE
ncbi:hypothetical protein ACRRFE_004921, partial [Escherichia coli]